MTDGPAGVSPADTPPTPVDRPFDHDPAGHTRSGRPRIIGLDVTRALALIGVVVMNYNGYLNGAGNPFDPSWAEQVFHPWEGVLSTRFAATFVLVAGMGVTLLTERSRTTGVGVTADRLRLLRRGAVLYVGGWVLDHHWPGTILFFYGAYFMVASVLFTLRTRWLVVIGALSALAGAGLARWVAEQSVDGTLVTWYEPDMHSLRGFLTGSFTGGTHPMLPWLTFFCAGLVIGRHLGRLGHLRPWLLVGGVTAVAVTYLVNHLATPSVDDEASALWAFTLSTRPFDRGLLYTVGTLGSSIAAFCIVSWLAERAPESPVVVLLRRAGQLTLTLYVLHVIVFKAAVEWTSSIGATGVDTALSFALGFWVVAVAAAAWWHKLLGQGPIERLYRRLGG